MEKEERFVRYFLESTETEKCDFLVEWFTSELKEIQKMPKRPVRKGTPKGDPYPLPYSKKMLALFQSIHPKLSLKKFADMVDTPYGTVRNWSSEKANKDLRSYFTMSLIDAYVRELKKRQSLYMLELENYESKEVGKASDKTRKLLFEAYHYPVFIQDLILERLSGEMKKGGKDEITLALLVRCFIGSISKWNIFNPPKRKADKKEFEAQIRRESEMVQSAMKEIISRVKQVIKNGDTAAALKIMDFIEDEMTRLVKIQEWLGVKILQKTNV
jgi:hypothetical protein